MARNNWGIDTIRLGALPSVYNQSQRIRPIGQDITLNWDAYAPFGRGYGYQSYGSSAYGGTAHSALKGYLVEVYFIVNGYDHLVRRNHCYTNMMVYSENENVEDARKFAYIGVSGFQTVVKFRVYPLTDHGRGTPAEFTTTEGSAASVKPDSHNHTLDGLIDVDVSAGKADGDVLIWDEADQAWKPSTIVGVSDGDKGHIIVSSAGTVWTFDPTVVTTFALTLLDDTTQGAMQSTLGLVIGTNVQAFDTQLAALAALTPTADQVPYFTSVSAAALMTVTSFMRSVLDDPTAPSARVTLKAAPSEAEYLVAASDGELSNGREMLDTDTIAWDFSVANEAKARIDSVASIDWGGFHTFTRSQLVFGRSLNTAFMCDHLDDSEMVLVGQAGKFISFGVYLDLYALTADTPLCRIDGESGVVSAAGSDDLHLVSVNRTIPAGSFAIFVRYMEIASGIGLEIGADGDLEVI